MTRSVETPNGPEYTVPVDAVGSAGTVAPTPVVYRIVTPASASAIVTDWPPANDPDAGDTDGAGGGVTSGGGVPEPPEMVSTSWGAVAAPPSRAAYINASAFSGYN